MWLGLHEFYGEGQWVWERSGRALNYTAWLQHEPSNSDIEDCGSFAKGGWNDLPCEDGEWPFFCQRT